MNWIYSASLLLAQLSDGDTPAPARSTAHPLNFSDLQKGLRLSHDGDPNDRPFQVALLSMVAAIAVFALILHLRQRSKAGVAPESPRKLARELSRGMPFPLGTRTLLNCVARHAGVPAVSLLLSASAFDSAVSSWCRQPTFSVLRQWAYHRLQQLKPLLFNA